MRCDPASQSSSPGVHTTAFSSSVKKRVLAATPRTGWLRRVEEVGEQHSCPWGLGFPFVEGEHEHSGEGPARGNVVSLVAARGAHAGLAAPSPGGGLLSSRHPQSAARGDERKQLQPSTGPALDGLQLHAAPRPHLCAPWWGGRGLKFPHLRSVWGPLSSSAARSRGVTAGRPEQMTHRLCSPGGSSAQLGVRA